MRYYPFTLFVLASLAFAGLISSARAAEPNARITVQADKPGAKISPLLYGIFFEEINRGGDGGLYAEMLQNRSFEDAPTPLGWTLLSVPNAPPESEMATMSLDTSRPLNDYNRTSLKIKIGNGPGMFYLINEGFKGAPYNRRGGPRDRGTPFDEAAAKQQCGLFVEKGKEYRFSMYVRSDDYHGTLDVEIRGRDEKVREKKRPHAKPDIPPPLAETSFDGVGRDWKKIEATLKSNATATDAYLAIFISGDSPATLYFDMISLMPTDTFKGHATRKDLTQMLADMHPAFVRFPGGCYVEGEVLAERFRWKNTLGDVAQRPGHYNLWGYYSNDGLGYHEYLQLCEDIGSEPLFVINCGMAHKDHVPMDKMDEYVQDAMDAIEYANGPVESKWGALRAKAGHPAPFRLKLMEIGNENGGPIYQERYALFYDAIKKRFPDVKLVVPLWDGKPSNRPIDLLDEHYYNSPNYFLGHTRQYDSYDRNSYKVYVGEYAVTSECGVGNLIAAVAEAAFMTGMERNGDVVAMSSYAPLFVHPAWKTWNPNAIVFDSVAGLRHAVLPGAGDVRGQPRRPGGRRFHPGSRSDFSAGHDRRRYVADAGRVQGHPGPALHSRVATARRSSPRISAKGSVLGGRSAANGKSATEHSASSAMETACGLSSAIPSGPITRSRSKPVRSPATRAFSSSSTTRTSKRTYWWNLGGWGNTQHKLEGDGFPDAGVPGKIETGRWYDIKIEVHGLQVTCSLDNKVVHRVTRSPLPSLAATAGLTAKGNELILKVVNGGDKALESQLSIRGLPEMKSIADLYVLTGRGPDEENSFAAPRNISVHQETIEASPRSSGLRFPRTP